MTTHKTNQQMSADAPLSIPEIIDKLTPYTGRFPKDALQSAMIQKEAITPHLLRSLEEAAESPEKFVGNDKMLHLFAVYLLAQFREKRAYRLLIKLLAFPGEIPDQLFGETITTALKNILGSVYDGDPEPMKRLIEDDGTEEFVRGSLVDAFVVLAHTGQMPREEVSRYYQSLFHGKLTRTPGQVWNDLACALADLPAPELLDDLQKAYDEDLIEYGYADFDELARDARNEHRAPAVRDQYALTRDAVSEMEWWAAFKEPERLPSKPASVAKRSPVAKSTNDFDTIARSVQAKRGVKIGRNEPCPCGSGKKYKRCCLGKA